MPAQQQKNNSASGMFSQNHVPHDYPQVIGVGGRPVQGARRYRWTPTLGYRSAPLDLRRQISRHLGTGILDSVQASGPVRGSERLRSAQRFAGPGPGAGSCEASDSTPLAAVQDRRDRLAVARLLEISRWRRARRLRPEPGRVPRLASLVLLALAIREERRPKRPGDAHRYEHTQNQAISTAYSRLTAWPRSAWRSELASRCGHPPGDRTQRSARSTASTANYTTRWQPLCARLC